MPDRFSPVRDAFRAAYGAALPEVVPNGIWDPQQARGKSYEQQLTMPYGIVDVTDFQPSDRDGIRNRAWRPAFALYYISEMLGDSDALLAKMQLLADYLDAHPLSVGQIIPPNVRIACGQDVEPNALLILLNATQNAGVVSGTVAIGVQR